MKNILFLVLSAWNVWSMQPVNQSPDERKTENCDNNIQTKLESMREHVQTISQQNWEKQKESIVLLGRTGCGKSTLFNYLLGKTLCSEYVGDQELDYQLVCEDTIPGTEIKNGVKSVTLRPIKKDIYWDFPGFGDTRNDEHCVKNAYTFYRLLSNMDNIKILFVMSEGDFRSDRCTSALETLHYFAENFSNFNEIMHAITLIITKTSKYQENDIQNRLKKFYVNNKKHLNTNMQKIFKRFSTNKHSVILFPEPKEEGDLSPNLRHRINKALEHHDSVTPKMALHFSDRAKKWLSELTGDLFSFLKKEQCLFEKMLKERVWGPIDDLQNLRSDLRQWSQALDPTQDLLPLCATICTLNHHKDNYAVFSEIFSFIKTVYSEGLTRYEDTQQLAKQQALSLHKILKEMSEVPQVVQYGQEFPQMNGYFISAKDINNTLKSNYHYKNLIINSLVVFIIDNNLKLPGCNLAVNAPKWMVKDTYTFNLNGDDGKSITPEVAPLNQKGKPGNPGKPGGHFFGYGNYFENIQKLQISVCGGKGGTGQRAGNAPSGDSANLHRCLAHFCEKVESGHIDSAQWLRRRYIRHNSFTKLCINTLLWNKVFNEEYSHWYDGKPGHNAMSGGIGGFGGLAGSIRIINTNLQEQQKKNNQGAIGENGSHGNKGLGGTGYLIKGIYSTIYKGHTRCKFVS